MSERTFTDTEAKREQTPLIVGLVGPTGSGKTGSALELAMGFQDVMGGDIGVIDSEARRALAYANAPMFSDPKRQFKFRHLPFGAPFGPADYQGACDHFVKKGIKHVIVDSTSHMWEGLGGIHEMHDMEVERLMKAWNCSGDKANFPAWAEPKRAQTAFVNWMKQQPVNFLFCFRAKEKLKMVNNKPVDAGWQAIGGEELLYEMTIACLLLPQCDGQPIWNRQEEKGVKALPQHFRPMFANNPRLSAAVGRDLAAWAKGEAPASGSAPTTTTGTSKKSEIPPRPMTEAIKKSLLDATKDMDVAPARARSAELLEKYFGSKSWAEVCGKPDPELEFQLEKMKVTESLP
jgi:hypothetical protein